MARKITPTLTLNAPNQSVMVRQSDHIVNGTNVQYRAINSHAAPHALKSPSPTIGTGYAQSFNTKGKRSNKSRPIVLVRRPTPRP